MLPYKVSQLCEILAGEPHNIDNDVEIRYLSTDSRQPILPQTLFFALIGPNYDAHNYLPDQTTQTICVVSKKVEAPAIVVKDTTQALQRLAAHHRRRFTGTLIAITGSHGKTFTKELAAQMLAPSRRLYKSPGSYNSQVGVALAILAIPLDAELALIEVGVSKVGEMETLSSMVSPDCTVITSIGNAHLGGFNGSIDAIAHEKLLLADAATSIVILNDPLDPENRRVKSGIGTLFHVKHRANSTTKLNIHDHSTSERSNTSFLEDRHYDATSIYRKKPGFSFAILCRSDKDPTSTDRTVAQVTTHFPGRYNIANVVAATAIADTFGASRHDIEQSALNFKPAPMRLEIHTTPSGIIILNDAYISDPTSARRAIDVLVHYAAKQRSIAILGDMGEVGKTATDEHMELGLYATLRGVQVIVAVGKYAEEIARGAQKGGHNPANLLVLPTTTDLDREIPHLLQREDVVLFKGRRALALEEAASKLLEPVAPTRLEIKLNAVTHNVAAVRSHIGPHVKIMAIVKSYAYGSDATKISKSLSRQNVEWFAVAYPDEAIPLRDTGIQNPILVMNVLAAESEKFAKYGLTGLVSDVETAQALSFAGTRQHKRIPLHLELDTGMHRLGMMLEDAPQIARKINDLPGVEITGVMTHFAAADDPHEDPFTQRQIADFITGADAITQVVNRRLLRHAANTAATWRFPQAHFDMVRLGIGLYGISPSHEVAQCAEMSSALRFVTKVLRVHDVPPGTSVGYNRRWLASRPTKIATIAVGYNDGFHRFMSKGGEVLLHGVRCPVIGAVCMDTCMIDITELTNVHTGDEVVLFGSQQTPTRHGTKTSFLGIEEMANRGDTIPYEILTGISSRVRRIFIEDD